jgi:hypothetical protein
MTLHQNLGFGRRSRTIAESAEIFAAKTIIRGATPDTLPERKWFTQF